MPSKRTVEQRKKAAAKKTRKRSDMVNPGNESTYAKKRRGIYPPNSPYLTIWREYA